MVAQVSRLILLVFLLYLVNKIASEVEFTNIKCTPLDPDFSSFEYCYLKSINRTYKYLSLKVNLHKTPVTKFKINIAMYKRFNGYRPFLYNVTVDGCKFMTRANPDPVAAYLYNLFKSYSNLNHSCPYDQDVVIDKLSTGFINHQVTKVLPVPHGDYLFHSNWLAYDINRATVNVYATIF